MMGANAVLFPTILPLVCADFQLNFATVGAVFPIHSLGALAGGMFAGVASDKRGRKPFLLYSALFSTLGMGLATFTHSWALFVSGYLVLGIAQGAFSITVNALVLDVSTKAHSKSLNYLHGFYSLGATLSPLIVLLLFHYHASWRMALGIASCNWMAMFLICAAIRFFPESVPQASKHSLLQLSAHPLILLLFSLSFFYSGAAWVLIGWLKTFLVSTNHSPQIATFMISVFYCALTIGRFGTASLAGAWGYRRALMLPALGALLVYPLVVFSDSIGWIGVGVFMSALFLAPLYPTAIAYGAQQFTENRGAVAGTFAIALSLGSMAPPYWTGWLGKEYGLAVALRWDYLLLFPLFAVTLFLPVLRQKPDERGVE